MLEKISQLSEATKETGKGRIHTAEPGGYGRKDDEDEEGKKVKQDTAPRGRGRPKKNADAETGEEKKYDFSAFGVKHGKDVKLPAYDKSKTKKHTLKDWFEQLDKELINETPTPVPVMQQGSNKATTTGMITVNDQSPAGKALNDTINNLAQQKKLSVVTPQGQQQTQQPQQGQ